MSAKFKIGDKVETNWFGTGEVTDVLYSASRDGYTYEVRDECNASELFAEEELSLVPEKKEYSMEVKIDIAQNVVIATLYEMTNNSKGVVAKGHGHLIHDGEIGIAQAASYACMRLYKSLGGFEK